ncbi:gulonolactone oxidase Lgo1 [Amanita muscaria]
MYSQLTPHPRTIPLQGLYELLGPVTIEHPSSRAQFRNWAGTYHCTPLAVFEPETEYQCELVLELARREGRKVKAVGVGHSPSDIACTKEIILRTEKLNRVIDINAEKRYVIAQGGITLTKLHHELAKHDLAMICIGSISDQTLAGVVTTASHGSGIHYGVMSTQVMAVTLLLSDGSRVTCSRHNQPELFLATICGLGATGIILSVQMEVEPAFRLKETQESVPFDVAMDDFDHMAASAQHVRFWWYPSTDTVRCSYSDRTQEPKVSPVPGWLAFLGDPVTQLLLFLGRFLSSLNILAAVLACWLIKNRTVCIDDSYRLFNIDPKYSQFTTEWAIPFENSKPCLREIDALLKQDRSDSRGLRPHFPIEIRFTSADDIWLSPSHGQLSCWIGIIQYRPFGFNVAYRKYFQHFEEIMAKYQGRPHWAKSHGLQPHELRRLYPKFDDFVRVIEETDPHGLFRNEYIERHILGRNISRRVFKLRQ